MALVTDLACRVLVAGCGAATGPLVVLSAPISLWGGVDVESGRIADPRHPAYGTRVAGAVLAIPDPVGSSSSSAIMLEMMRAGTAPAAVVLGRPDAILALGVVVGRELGYRALPVLHASPVVMRALDAANGGTLTVLPDGSLREAVQVAGSESPAAKEAASGGARPSEPAARIRVLPSRSTEP